MVDTKHLFKTDEFAKLCGVNKKTLLYYDSIDLFTPYLIDSNGYRYYSFHQYDTFGIISILKELNMPLKEIKSFIENRSPELLVSILTEQHHHLQSRIQKLIQTSKVIDTVIQTTQMAHLIASDRCTLEEQPISYLTLSNPITTHDTKAFLKILSEHIKYCIANNLQEGHPIGGLTCKENILSKQYTALSYIFTQTNEPFSSEFMHTKPSGLYATAYHYGDYDTTPTTYERLITFIGTCGMKIIGNSYEETLLDSLSQQNANDYVTKISILVAPLNTPD